MFDSWLSVIMPILLIFIVLGAISGGGAKIGLLLVFCAVAFTTYHVAKGFAENG